MYSKDTLGQLGLYFLVIFIACSTASTIGGKDPSIARATSSDRHMARSLGFYPVPSISIRTNDPYQLSTRGFKPVPGLPDGWEAHYSTVRCLIPINVSSRGIQVFYNAILQALSDGLVREDTVKRSFQLGHLLFQFQSKNRKEKLVTQELITAVIAMLMDYARGGFVDLFKAELSHQADGLAVFLVLQVTSSATKTLKIT